MRRKCQWQRGTASSFKLKSCLSLCVFSSSELCALPHPSLPSLSSECLVFAYELYLSPPRAPFLSWPQAFHSCVGGRFPPVLSLSQPFSCPAGRGPCTLPASHGALLPSRLCASQIWLPTAAGQRGASPSSSAQFHGIGRNVKNKWNTFFFGCSNAFSLLPVLFLNRYFVLLQFTLGCVTVLRFLSGLHSVHHFNSWGNSIYGILLLLLSK